MPNREDEKKLAAAASLEHVESGMAIGLGTGSTAECLIRLLGQRIAQGLKVRAVPTSRRTAELAQQCGIPLTTLQECPRLDLTLDGADEVDARLQLIKGGGGALLREKIVASASQRMIVIVDSSKLVRTLGAFPLPVEVVPFGWPVVKQRLEEMGAQVSLRRSPGGGAFVSDEGNSILDCRFRSIPDPSQLALRISPVAGVVEHGLFIDRCDLALIGRGGQVQRLARG
ncbi:MAG: ribose-5-phosphate isomerase RpiA [Acidobacteriota bacterium]